MTTTTDYGSWSSIMGLTGQANPGTYVENCLGDAARDFDIDSLEEWYRDRIDNALDGTGITLHGDQFIGPAHPDEDEAAAQEAIDLREAIEAIDIYEVARRYEWASIVDTAAAGAAARERIRENIADLVPAKYAEAELARKIGVDRMTVRAWLGKR